MSKTVMILGGGVGGLVTANLLRKALPREHRVVLVERDAAFAFAPSFLWLMTGDRTAEKISRPLARLSKKGIEVIRGEVQYVNLERREATVEGRTLGCDYLVIALGAELAPEAIPGLQQAGHTFYTLAGAEGLRDALGAFSGGKLVVLTAAPMYKCPAAPYEAAMLLEVRCESAGSASRPRLTSTRPNRGRWASQAPRYQRPSGKWWSRRASPTTPSTR